MEQIFIRSVPKELQAERSALMDYIQSDGFLRRCAKDQTRRAVSENARTLGFSPACRSAMCVSVGIFGEDR